MPTYEDLISLRAVREYADKPVEDGIVDRILQAGRTSGSSRNIQPWHFYVSRNRDVLDHIAPTVYAPENLERCRMAIAIASPKGGLDIGRCAERMMIAAWADGIVSSPNGIKDQQALAGILGFGEDQTVSIILSFGHPTRERRDRTAVAILDGINRKTLSELVTEL